MYVCVCNCMYLHMHVKYYVCKYACICLCMLFVQAWACVCGRRVLANLCMKIRMRACTCMQDCKCGRRSVSLLCACVDERVSAGVNVMQWAALIRASAESHKSSCCSRRTSFIMKASPTYATTILKTERLLGSKVSNAFYLLETSASYIVHTCIHSNIQIHIHTSTFINFPFLAVMKSGALLSSHIEGAL